MVVAAELDWPRKTRELVYWVMDSRPWNDFAYRPDDIVVCTWSKAGTTWLQQIVSQLIFGGRADLYGQDVSPWIDSRLTPDAPEQARLQTHRRILKTHLPIDALVYSPDAKYLYIGRDIRDIFWSWYNHYANFTPEALSYINSLPGREGPEVGYPDPDIRTAFRDWLARDGYPCWPFWSHVQGWWDARRLPNLRLLHYADLLADPEGQIRRIADFLGIAIREEAWPAILQYCSFGHMKQLAARNERLAQVFKGGGATFVHKGTNGRWRDVLSLEDLAICDATAARNLSADCAHWLATGRISG